MGILLLVLTIWYAAIRMHYNYAVQAVCAGRDYEFA